ncbi:MAG: L-aspartate oxidase [Dehalococcoidales bacterium]|nr:L-aspartate oxidase [Dehalococcoidales bacterium]
MARNRASSYYDYIIIGSGIAGLYSALLSNELGSVLIVTKGSIDDCNTRYAQGGIAAPVGENDSVSLHFQDTMNAGAGLCDEESVRILVAEATDRIADLVRFGVSFDTFNGEVALGREAAHSVPRVLHAGGDATGERLETTLSRRVRENSIRVLEYSLATQILVSKGKLRGIRVLDGRSSFIRDYACRYLILATGGAGRLFKHTTNPDVATGDGIALAYNAGVEITDMEFFQFHPTALHMPGVHPFLISEAVRGEGGILRNNQKRAFMVDYSPQKELAPRDVVARSIIYEMRKTGSNSVFLDITHLQGAKVTTRFPQIYRFCLDHGLDITREFIPVAPAAHYTIGGVRVNTWGESNIPGILAVGECACTGVHGANRLASNSLLEGIVFGKRAIERTQQKNPAEIKPANMAEHYKLPGRKTIKKVPQLNLPNLQSLLWDKVGILRSGEGLAEMADILAGWQTVLPEPTDQPWFELNSLVACGRLMTEAALLRTESRGTHSRTDCPETSADWEKHIVFRNDDAAE